MAARLPGIRVRMQNALICMVAGQPEADSAAAPIGGSMRVRERGFAMHGDPLASGGRLSVVAVAVIPGTPIVMAAQVDSVIDVCLRAISTKTHPGCMSMTSPSGPPGKTRIRIRGPHSQDPRGGRVYDLAAGPTMESHAHSYRRSALASSACNRETISPSGFSRSHESQDVPRHPRLDHAQLKRRTTDMPGVEPDIGGPSLARNRPLLPRVALRSVG